MIPRLAARAELERAHLPTGTVTFTDIEGSTRMVQVVDHFMKEMSYTERALFEEGYNAGGRRKGANGPCLTSRSPEPGTSPCTCGPCPSSLGQPGLDLG